MHDGLLRLLTDHLGDEAAVAVQRILLEAEQARAPLACQALGLRQLGLCAIRRHVLAEYRLHAFRMACTDGIASRLGCAQALEVHIGDALSIQSGGELTLRKAGLA